jgi:hypothetical protein
MDSNGLANLKKTLEESNITPLIELIVKDSDGSSIIQ